MIVWRPKKNTDWNKHEPTIYISVNPAVNGHILESGKGDTREGVREDGWTSPFICCQRHRKPLTPTVITAISYGKPSLFFLFIWINLFLSLSISLNMEVEFILTPDTRIVPSTWTKEIVIFQWSHVTLKSWKAKTQPSLWDTAFV